MKKIVLTTTLMLSMLFIGGCSTTVEDDNIIATVNGNDITVDYYKKTLELEKQDIEDERGLNVWEEVEGDVTFEEQFKEDVLNQIINTYVIYDKAKEENLLPTDEEIQGVADTKMDLVNLRDNKDYLINTVGIDEVYLKEYSEKFFTYTSYKHKLIEDNTSTGNKEIEEYYNKNLDEFHKEEIRASHIQISSNYVKGLERSEETDIKDQEKAHEILEQINNGESFEELAVQNSHCSSSANGGDLGYFSEGMMVDRFYNAALHLDINEISDIIETEYGYHIIKVTDKRKDLMPLEEAQHFVRASLLDSKFNEKLEEALSNADIHRNDKAIEKFNKTYSLSNNI